MGLSTRFEDWNMSEKCPACKRPGIESGQRLWYCPTCQMEFESGDDGTIGYGDPTYYAERNERHKKKKGTRNA